MYKQVITSLGVEFSAAKTHESERFFEFAKRLYLDGKEITPFPISALPSCGKSVFQLTHLMMEARDKGWAFADLPSAVSRYVGIV